MTEQHARRLFHMPPDQYFANAGWVYVLGNEFMPDVYKIGRTTGRIERRMRQLFTTGVPCEFHLVHADWFANCIAAEEAIHDFLNKYRVNEGREFFKSDISVIIDAFRLYMATGENHPEHMLPLVSNRYKYATEREMVKGEPALKPRRSVGDEGVPF